MIENLQNPSFSITISAPYARINGARLLNLTDLLRWYYKPWKFINLLICRQKPTSPYPKIVLQSHQVCKITSLNVHWRFISYKIWSPPDSWISQSKWTFCPKNNEICHLGAEKQSPLRKYNSRMVPDNAILKSTSFKIAIYDLKKMIFWWKMYCMKIQKWT